MRSHVKEIKQKKLKAIWQTVNCGDFNTQIMGILLPQLQIFRSKIISYAKLTLQLRILTRIIK